MGFWAWEILCALFKSRTSISYSPLTLLYASPSVQFSSIAQLCPTFCDSMGGSMPGLQASITSSWSLLKLVSTESVIPSTHLILCHPLLLQPSVFTSIRVFSLTQVNESVLCIRWPKYWSFSFSISPSNEHPGLISFRMDWFDLLTVQGTLKSLLQHHSSKASILQHSAFFTVQLSHPYMTTEKNIALTRQTFVGKGMSLLFNMLKYSSPTGLQSETLWILISRVQKPSVGETDVGLRFLAPWGESCNSYFLPFVDHPSHGYGFSLYCDSTPRTLLILVPSSYF